MMASGLLGTALRNANVPIISRYQARPRLLMPPLHLRRGGDNRESVMLTAGEVEASHRRH